jgi:hypothetical protein
MNPTGHGQSVFHFVIDDRVAADDERAGFVDLVLAAAKNLSKNFDWEPIDRPADDVQRRHRLTTHRVDVGQRVGRGDLAEAKGIVDDRGEEIDGLNEGQIIGQRKNPGVIEGLETDDEPRIRAPWQAAQGTREVARTQLGGSTRAAGKRRETKELVSRVRAR